MRTCSRLILVLVLLPATPAVAELPDLDACHAEMPEGHLPRYLVILPDGSGPPLTAARVDGGAQVSAHIILTMLDHGGDPMDGYPAEDIWLQDACDEASFCSHANPDGPTDVYGRTGFTGPYAGGGHMPPGCVIEVIIGGMPLTEPGLELRFYGPDINGDLVVNLPDIVLFSQAIEAYDWSADFNVDGAVNLTEIESMTQGSGAACS